MLTMVLVLGFSAICSASNGKVLDAEEAMVNKFLAASNYSAVTSMMTDGMKKDFTEEVFKNFKEQMDKNFGAVSEKRFKIQHEICQTARSNDELPVCSQKRKTFIR